MLHILPFPFPFPSLPLTFSASFLTFGKCQRKNCAQNEAQFTALVVCKLSHLQCAPRSFPTPLTLLSWFPPLSIPFPLWLLVLVFYYSILPATFSSYIHKFISFVFPSLPSPSSLPLIAPRQSTEACPCPYFGSYSPKLLPFGNLHLQFHAFLQIYTFVGVLFYWVSSLVSIRFLAREGGGEGEAGYPLNGV